MVGRCLAVCCALAMGACVTSPLAHGEATSNHRIGPPGVDRCGKIANEARKMDCESLRDEAFVFVRKLAVDDMVCLEGNPLSAGVTKACKVRAFVEDVAPGSVKLEIRDAAPRSHYKAMEDYWFHEKALVDLYLTTRGFK